MYFVNIQDVKIKNEKLFEYIKSPKTFIVRLFPYFVNNNLGNISKYARGKDYHIVVKNELEKDILKLKKKFPDNEFYAFCDNSPIDEVQIAYKSGAGILGRQGLIFDKEYGGYVFIGIIATDAEIEFEKKEPKKCINCGLCVKNCPSRALDNMDFSKCLSEQTQKNSSDIDEKMIANSDFIWGCDICLDVCPMNKKAKKTENPFFSENLIYFLEEEEISGLSRKEFNEKYPERAFTFRGTKPILRNIELQKLSKKQP